MERNELFESLKIFIINQTFVDDVQITRDTIIETEFGVTGDDVDDFIIAFSREFNVDISNFDSSKHFKEEGDPTLMSIFNLLRGKKMEERRTPLTVGDLERAIKKGKLDETVINSSNV